MSSIRFIQRTIDQMGDLIRSTWVGGHRFEKVDDDYQALRRRLYALEPIVGQPPAFLKAAENLWELWNSQVKVKLPSYDSRREFLDKNYVTYYKDLIEKINTGTFEQEMMLRDLALIRQIGEGGFGVVYSAEHIVLDDLRAIKKLEPIFADDKEEEIALRRFAREATMLHQLSHPGIVRFFDAGMVGGHPYIVMELVEGENLRDIINEQGPQPVEVAMEIMRQILDAVGRAHQKGIVHRDIKPTNLMWDGKRAVVLDYGAGHWLEHQLSTRMTTGLVGTSGYIADELLENPKLVSPSLDCFSLGVVFHYLLTGHRPSTGDPTHYLNEKGIKKNIQHIIMNALSPAKIRFASGTAFLDALNRIDA